MFLSFTKSQCAGFSTVQHTHNIQSDNHHDIGWISSFGLVNVNCCQDHTFYDSPGVQTSSNPLAFGLHHCVAADDGEGNAVLREENRLNTNTNSSYQNTNMWKYTGKYNDRFPYIHVFISNIHYIAKSIGTPSLEQKNALPNLWQQRWEHNSCV